MSYKEERQTWVVKRDRTITLRKKGFSLFSFLFLDRGPTCVNERRQKHLEGDPGPLPRSQTKEPSCFRPDVVNEGSYCSLGRRPGRLTLVGLIWFPQGGAVRRGNLSYPRPLTRKVWNIRIILDKNKKKELGISFVLRWYYSLSIRLTGPFYLVCKRRKCLWCNQWWSQDVVFRKRICPGSYLRKNKGYIVKTKKEKN